MFLITANPEILSGPEGFSLVKLALIIGKHFFEKPTCINGGCR